MTYDYNGHISPHDGRHGYEYIYDTGIECPSASENYYVGGGAYVTSSQALDWWIHSKPHYDAMVDPKYSTTGFGIATRANGDLIAVEHFCQKP